MKVQKTYTVRAFARLAGVTVRALQYYDRIGLLRPSQRTAAGHRLYHQEDLLPLQQIVTLKAMGFSLKEIGELLNSAGDDVQKSLRMQKEAVDRRIAQLQQVSQGLDRVLAMLAAAPGEIDWEHVGAVIRIMTAGEELAQWTRRYFTEEQSAQIAARQVPQEDVWAGERAWMDLIDAFRDHRHLPPDHPGVQELAARAWQLVGQFTGGDPGLQKSLETMYGDYDDMPDSLGPKDADLQRFMGEAMDIYEKRSKGQ